MELSLVSGAGSRVKEVFPTAIKREETGSGLETAGWGLSLKEHWECEMQVEPWRSQLEI